MREMKSWKERTIKRLVRLGANRRYMVYPLLAAIAVVLGIYYAAGFFVRLTEDRSWCRRVIAAALCACMVFTGAAGRMTVWSAVIDKSKGPEDMVKALLGTGITATNITVKGSVYEYEDSENAVGLQSALVLDTGDDGSGDDRSADKDADLATLIESEDKKYGGHTSSVQFTMTATGTLLNFNYVFASKEFDQDAKYNDIFGLFVSVNGGPFENIALLDNGKHITISNLRAGKDGTQNENGAGKVSALGTYDYFTIVTTSRIDLNDDGYRGYSNLFNAQKEVSVGDTVTVKFVIADVGDTGYNSYVFIEKGSLSFEPKSSINYAEEKLYDMDPNSVYKITVDGVTYQITSNDKGEIPLYGLDDNGNTYDFCGKTLTIVQIKNGQESDPLNLVVSGRPETPDNPNVGTSEDIEAAATPEEAKRSDVVIGANEITLTNTVAGQVYAIVPKGGTVGTDTEWVIPGEDGTISFGNLEEGTDYTIYTKIQATEDRPASLPSPGVTITYKERTAYAAVAVAEYQGVYDGQPHSISVTAEGATVTYSDTYEGNYVDDQPVYTDACEPQTVYYRVVRYGYSPVYGSAIVSIGKKEVSISGLSAENKVYDGTTAATIAGTPAIDGLIDADADCQTAHCGRHEPHFDFGASVSPIVQSGR